MRRRALLASTAALAAAGTAGCLSGDDGATTTDDSGTTEDFGTGDSGTDDDPNTESMTTDDGPRVVGAGDTVTVDGIDIDLLSLSLQSTFVERNWPYWNAHALDEGLFAVLSVNATERNQDFSLNVPVGARAKDELFRGGEAYARMNGAKPTSFAVPVPTGDDVERAALVVYGDDGPARYPLENDHLQTLQTPPSLTAHAEIPNTVDVGSALQFDVAVENTGDSTGTLAATTTHDAIHDKYWTRRTTVDPGTTNTITYEIPTYVEQEYDLEVDVDWGHDTTTKTVQIREN